MYMKIHCIQHVEFEGLANIESWILKKGYQVTYTMLYNNEALPEPDDFDLLIVMGGPMSFDDDEKYSWLASERKFLKKVISAGKSILGICLGAQIIADTISGSAKHSNSKEIGWFPIYFNKKNEIKGFDFIPDNIIAFHWHGDTFYIPEGAIRLASSDEFPNQGFVYNNNVIGLQFHLEMNNISLSGMIENCGSELIPSIWVQNEEQIINGLKYTIDSNDLMFKIMDYLEAVS